MNDWALEELIGHYVNARKQRSRSLDELLPASDFQLYAVCVRFPLDLSQQVLLRKRRAGVYDLQFIQRQIRIIVVQELPQEEQNALLHLFSGRVEQVRYGREHYRPRTQDMTTLFYDLINFYFEDPAMSNALKEYARERMKELLKSVPAEERLEGISLEKRLEGQSIKELLKVVPAEERLEGLSAQQVIQALSPEQRKAMETLLREGQTDDRP